MIIFDSHIHLDQFRHDEISEMVEKYENLKGLISVSTNLVSSKRNLCLSSKYKKVHAAFGFHPEQELPTDYELDELFKWMGEHKDDMIAIGEVGLPYYSRKQQNSCSFPDQSYIELLEHFIILAKKWNKPVILHAVYEDAPIACGLLEKHSVKKVHFHWFKGDRKTMERLIANGYYVSFTPDLVYEKEIQELAKWYPFLLCMAETDGPWPFDGPFKGQRTHPKMIEKTIKAFSDLRALSVTEVSSQLYENTRAFYQL